MVYFDAASAAPLHHVARQALLASLDEGWADPARLYREGRRARLLLDELADAHLLTEHAPGRYTQHRLLRVFAAEPTTTYDSPEDRRAAGRRLLDHDSRADTP